MRTHVLTALASLAVSTIPLAAQQPSVRDQLLAAERAVSDSSAAGAFAAALTGAMTPDAAYLHPGAPLILGADRARAFLASHAGLAGLLVQWQALHVEVSGDSMFGVTWGVATARGAAGPARLGKYLAAWTRSDGSWRLSAVVFLGILPLATPATIAGLPLSNPPAASGGTGAPFAAADIAFSDLAGRAGASAAFYRFAAADAVNFPGSGLLTRGRDHIREALRGDEAHWAWHPVAAGGSTRGDLGFTAGEAVITSVAADGARQTFYSKYVTLWRREGRAVRFLADGGNGRPADVIGASR